MIVNIFNSHTADFWDFALIAAQGGRARVVSLDVLHDALHLLLHLVKKELALPGIVRLM